MYKYLFAVAVFFVCGVSPAHAEYCGFGNPLPGLPSSGSDWVEYKEGTFLQEVEIVTNRGNISCLVQLGNGVSLLVPPGFKTAEDHRGASYESLSRVKKADESYPIVGRYNLTVFPADKTEGVTLPPQEKKYLYQQQERIYQSRPLLEGLNKSKKDEGFSCGGWCKAGLVVLTIVAVNRAIEINNSRNNQTTTTNTGTGGPVNPAP